MKTAVTRAKLERTVSLDRVKDAERLPVAAAILLPEDYLKKLPLPAGKDQTLRPWFFQGSLAPAFQRVDAIKRLDDLSQHPEARIVIQPELWGFFDQGYGDGWGQVEWTCWLNFRFRVLDRNGHQVTSIPAEGFACRSSTVTAWANTMDLIVERVQRELKQTRREAILAAAGQ